MSWLTAISDVRLKLSDNPNDKLRAFKKVLGQVDGVNVLFKSFEFRRVTDFTSAAAPLGVYVNQSRLDTTDIASDDLQTGYFTLVTPPAADAAVEATYYVQFFYDTELEGFLRLSANWLGFGDDFTTITEGLRPAAIQYAIGDAYQKLAMRFAEHISETYRLEDAPTEDRFRIVEQYKQLAAQSHEEARGFRDEFYKRQGQPLAPIYGLNKGFVRDVGPNR
jgi:hypothetical protein